MEQRWFNPNEPLWLPKGTVRALLVLGLTWALIVVMLKFAILQQEIPASVEKVMMAMLPAIVLLVKDYISARNGKSKDANGSNSVHPAA
jgi:hypothetical protein